MSGLVSILVSTIEIAVRHGLANMHWYNGALITDSLTTGSSVEKLLDDPGLRFGASVFTTLRVYANCLEDPRSQWQAHCDRLIHSIKAFQWRSPNWPAIYKGAEQLKKHYPILRITLFPDGKEWITGRSLPPQLSRQQQLGITCWIAPPTYTRSLPAHKTGNYLACQLARQQAQAHGAQEAILTSLDGHALETTTGNLWGWAAGQWWTPVSTQAGYECLPGLMRERMWQLLTRQGTTVNTQKWTPARLRSFEAIAYSNCVVELLPIHTVLQGTQQISFDPHHHKLRSLLQQIQQTANDR
ncbi:MAG: aminotransferase class IV [Cyanobacteria bacterium J06581_3]